MTDIYHKLNLMKEPMEPMEDFLEGKKEDLEYYSIFIEDKKLLEENNVSSAYYRLFREYNKNDKTDKEKLIIGKKLYRSHVCVLIRKIQDFLGKIIKLK
jgi:hypothetical protein